MARTITSDLSTGPVPAPTVRGSKRKLLTNTEFSWAVPNIPHVETIIDTAKGQVVHRMAVEEGNYPYYPDTVVRARASPIVGLPKVSDNKDSYLVSMKVSAKSNKIYGAKLVPVDSKGDHLHHPEKESKEDGDYTSKTLGRSTSSLAQISTSISAPFSTTTSTPSTPFKLDSIIYGVETPEDVLKHVQIGNKRIYTFPLTDLHLTWGPRVSQCVEESLSFHPSSSFSSSSSTSLAVAPIYYEDVDDDDDDDHDKDNEKARSTKITKPTLPPGALSSSVSNPSTAPLPRTIRLSVLPSMTHVQIFECSRFSGRQLRMMMINKGFGEYLKRYIGDMEVKKHCDRHRLSRTQFMTDWWTKRSANTVADERLTSEEIELIYYQHPNVVEKVFNKREYTVVNPDNFLDWFIGVQKYFVNGSESDWIQIIWNAFIEYTLETICVLTVDQLVAILVMLIWIIDVRVVDDDKLWSSSELVLPDHSDNHGISLGNVYDREESLRLKKKIEDSKLVRFHDKDTINAIGTNSATFSALMLCLDMLLYGHRNIGCDWSIRDRGILRSLFEIEKVQRDKLESIIDPVMDVVESSSASSSIVDDNVCKKMVDNFLDLYVSGSYLHTVISSMPIDKRNRIITSLARRNDIESLFI
jgi:hypothetical protein